MIFITLQKYGHVCPFTVMSTRTALLSCAQNQYVIRPPATSSRGLP